MPDLSAPELTSRENIYTLTKFDGEGVYDVLVVDPDYATRELLYTVLQREGFTIDVAASCADALSCLQLRRYHVLLLDLTVQTEATLAMLRELQAAALTRPATVIGLASLNGSRQDLLEALHLGIDDYLTKPLDIGTLLFRINVWLDRNKEKLPVDKPGMRIYSLGEFRVAYNDTVRLRAGDRARKASTLFKYLLTQRGNAVPTQKVLALLWPQISEDVAAMDLRSLIYQLRQTLGIKASDDLGLQYSSATLALRLGPNDWWDVIAFTALLAEGARWQSSGHIDRALAAYSSGVALYTGDYLQQDIHASWAVSYRDQLREDWLHALSLMARLHHERGEDQLEESVLQTIVRADPYREASYRALMRQLVAQGRNAEALVLYRNLEQRLRTELKAKPAPETRALAHRVRDADTHL